MSTDGRKLQGTSKVSRAVCPERIRLNLATGKTSQWRRAMMLRGFYQPDPQKRRKSHSIQRSKRGATPYRWRARSLLFQTYRRVAFSLPIISIFLAVCLWQHWYAQLMLVAFCIAANILFRHFLFNDNTPAPSMRTRKSPMSLPRSARTSFPGKSPIADDPSVVGTSHDEAGSYSASKNVDRLNNRPLVADKPLSTRSLPSMTFPDTPMPATPLIRVLETIDLSSTNVEHFLDLAERAERAETYPPSQEPPYQQPE